MRINKARGVVEEGAEKSQCAGVSKGCVGDEEKGAAGVFIILYGHFVAVRLSQLCTVIVYF